MKKITILVCVVMVASLTVGALALGSDFASDPVEASQETNTAPQAAEATTVSTTSTAKQTSSTPSTQRGRMPGGFSPEMLRGFNMSGFQLPFDMPDFSKYEGMTDEERAAAMQADAEEILKQLIASGLVTQEQADKLLEKFDSFSQTPFGFGRGNREGFTPSFDFGEKSRGGYSFPFEMPDLSKYEGMTNEEKAAAMKNDVKVMLDELVANGTITQEQADSMASMLERFPQGFSRGNRTFPRGKAESDGV